MKICGMADRIKGCPIYVAISKFSTIIYSHHIIFVCVCLLHNVSVVGYKTFFYSHTHNKNKRATQSCLIHESVNESQFRCFYFVRVCVWGNSELLLLISFTHLTSMSYFAVALWTEIFPIPFLIYKWLNGWTTTTITTLKIHSIKLENFSFFLWQGHLSHSMVLVWLSARWFVKFAYTHLFGFE